MKNMKNVFLLTVLMTSLFISCSNEGNLYSCDRKMNEWVTDNLSEIQLMDRSDWLKCDLSTGVVLYRAFTPKQRKELWQAKIKEVKLLPWTNKELAHIQQIEDFINTYDELFEQEKSEEFYEYMEIFMYKWQQYAKNNLGWTDKICIAIAGTGYKMLGINGDIDIPVKEQMSSTTKAGGSEGSCHCNTTYDFCTGSYSCEDVNCTSSSIGCGWFLAGQCNGRCAGI